MKPRLTNKEKIQAALTVLRQDAPVGLKESKQKKRRSLLKALAEIKKQEDERNG